MPYNGHIPIDKMFKFYRSTDNDNTDKLVTADTIKLIDYPPPELFPYSNAHKLITQKLIKLLVHLISSPTHLTAAMRCTVQPARAAASILFFSCTSICTTFARPGSVTSQHTATAAAFQVAHSTQWWTASGRPCSLQQQPPYRKVRERKCISTGASHPATDTFSLCLSLLIYMSCCLCVSYGRRD